MALPQYGTAPRKINGVWVTRSGRKLSAAGQDYWDNLAAQGHTDTRGHITRPAQTAEGKTSLVMKPVQVAPKPVTKPQQPTRLQMALAQAAAQGQTDPKRPDVREAIRATRAYNKAGHTLFHDVVGAAKGVRHFADAAAAGAAQGVAGAIGLDPHRLGFAPSSPKTGVMGSPVPGVSPRTVVRTAKTAEKTAAAATSQDVVNLLTGHGKVSPLGTALGLAAIVPGGLKAGEDIVRAAKAGKGLETAAKAGVDLEKAGKAGQVLPVPSEQAQEVAAAFSGAKSARAAQDVRRSQEFQRRVGKVDAAFEAEGGGRAGHFAGLRQMGGAYEKLPFGALQHATPETLDKLHNEIQDLPHLQTMEKRRLGIAIENAAAHGRLPQPNEIDLMEKAFGKEAAQQFASAGKVPIGDVISNIANIPRSIMSAGDLSAPFRQGLMAFAMHPALAAKQLPKMFRDFASEAHYGKGMGEIHADPEFENSLQAGVGYTELGPRAAHREEAFGSKAAEGISPGLLIGKPGRGGSIVRASGRAYTGFLDRTRLELYKSLKAEAQAAGHDLQRVESFGPGKKLVRAPQTLDKDIAELVNWATGRGTFKSAKMEGAAPLLNSVFFSPRLFKSRLDAVNPAFYNRLDPFARKKAMNSVIRMVATGAGVLALAKYVGGANVELDPRSSDWGKIRIGKTRYDVWGGYQQVARTIAQEISQTTKSATTGEFKHPKGRLDPAINFFENKFSPPLALVKDIHSKQMFGGKPVTPLNELKEKGQPILWQDMRDAIRSGDWKNAAATGVLGTFGFGAQTFSSQKPPTPKHPGSGKFFNPRALPSLSEVAHQQGHGRPGAGTLPSLAEVAHRQGH